MTLKVIKPRSIGSYKNLPYIQNFVKQVKGSSSHFINHEIQTDFLFKWQGSYGALTVSKGGVDDLCEYIDGQEEHHRRRSLISDWEPI